MWPFNKKAEPKTTEEPGELYRVVRETRGDGSVAYLVEAKTYAGYWYQTGRTHKTLAAAQREAQEMERDYQARQVIDRKVVG